MDHALLGAEPAQLAVARERAPEPARVGFEFVEVAADDVVAKGLDRRAAQLVAAADREGHAVARQAPGSSVSRTT